VDREHPNISLVRQCELLDLNRSTLYYKPVGVDEETLVLMRLLDEQYTRTPFYGVLRMQAYLRRAGYQVNEKRVRRLLRLMGLEAIYTKPRLSKANTEHRVYPYLLRDVPIVRRNQVWSTDITYIRLHKGFVYLVAVIDWFSRYVLSWRLSTTLDTVFCMEALEAAWRYGTPDIFNSDQGSQFTSREFTESLIMHGAQISMDGRGRALDNIFVERLWRSVKYEEVYLHDYQQVADAQEGLSNYFKFYNNERLHQSLNYCTPKEVYLYGALPQTPGYLLT